MRYRSYDQAGLDAQYNLRQRHPEFETYFRAWDESSAAARQALRCALDVRYGRAPKETLDYFPAARPDAPLHIFIHGGYWQNLDKKDFSYLAPPFVAAGAAVAIVNYDLAPSVTVAEIVRQNRAALAWLWRHAAEREFDRDRIVVSGHSAGGHLAAMLAATRWPAFDPGLPQQPVHGICAVSGIYDLEPIRLSYQNAVLALDDAAVALNSPLHHPPAGRLALVLAVGAEETDEFLRQTNTYAGECARHGVVAERLTVPARNHFTVIDDMTDTRSPLHRAVLRLLGLG
ncbi:MAG: alpha/beta hydrolase [Alphaproteobacteria bacterium]|nr:alpha/beta hydrolase [Alphaproteobacteria bacterium]